MWLGVSLTSWTNDVASATMRLRGKFGILLFAVLVALALQVATASAASTVTVDSTADETLSSAGLSLDSCESEAGKCTLRAAVELADETSEDVTIDLPEGTYTESHMPAPLLVREDAEVTIDGAGASSTIIAGDEEGSVLEVAGNSSLTLNGVTVEHGVEFEGGGIFVFSGATLIVEHSVVTENLAEDVGGGILGAPDSTTEVLGSSVTDNLAGSGGGIAFETEDECDDARSANRAGRVEHAALPADLEIGLTVSQSTVEGNHAEFGVGGGILAAPERCEEVAARASSTRASSRPAIEALPSEANLTVEQSTIASNSAVDDEDGESAGVGGGIYEEAFLDDPIVDSTIAENVAGSTGGGVAVGEGRAVLVSDTVSGNEVEPGEGEPEPEPGISPTWRSARRGAARARRDAGASEPLTGGNLAADPDAPAAIELRNTIVAEPEGSESENCGEGRVESLIEGAGFNLDYPSVTAEGETLDNCGLSSEDQDLVGVNPDFAKAGLHENGGPTDTIALEPESPAIGAVPLAEDCEEEGTGPALPNGLGESKPVDQRGEPRPGIAGKGCDIGAYEYQLGPEEKHEEPTKTTPTPPVPVPVPTPTPAPAPAPAPAAQTSVLPFKVEVPAQCTSKRDFVIHIQNVKQFGIVSAVVSIDGKVVRKLSGKRLLTAIDLRGLPKGTFTVEIVARTRGGRTLHGKRTYHTCRTTPLPGHSYLPL